MLLHTDPRASLESWADHCVRFSYSLIGLPCLGSCVYDPILGAIKTLSLGLL